MNKKPLGVYVHIPFCLKKCLYCDFNSYDNKTQLKEAYTKALIREIGAFCADGYFVDSIFFGGGTPTTLPLNLIGEIFNALEDKFTIAQTAEITCETNPGVLSDHSQLKAIGFNRLSMGLQSANDEELKLLGRIHTYHDFLKSYENARSAFDNINIDTMFALPDQTVEKWTNTLAKVKELNPEHISCYSLIIEEGTPFWDMPLNLPEEEEDRRLYHLTKEILSGYERYEISNYAKPGFECRHNIKYWERMPYVGFGCGAHSQLQSSRLANEYNIADYIENPLQREVTPLTRKDEISEFIFLSLRMTKGVNKNRFKELFNKNIEEIFAKEIAYHKKAGTLEENNIYIYLTDRGVDVSNTVMADFIL